MTAMEELRLTALDEEDLSVISAHLQDAVILIGEMKFTPARRQFALIANRFDWEHSQNGRANRSSGGGQVCISTR